MNSTRSQPQRREETVHIINGAAADKRQCAVEFAFGARQRGNEARGRHNLVGPRRQVEKGAIDVEKNGKGGVAQ